MNNVNCFNVMRIQKHRIDAEKVADCAKIIAEYFSRDAKSREVALINGELEAVLSIVVRGIVREKSVLAGAEITGQALGFDSSQRGPKLEA